MNNNNNENVNRQTLITIADLHCIAKRKGHFGYLFLPYDFERKP